MISRLDTLVSWRRELWQASGLKIRLRLMSHHLTPSDTESPPPTRQELITEMRRTNELLIRLIRVQTDWRLALRQGLMTGLGGIIGATILVSLFLWALRPLERLDGFKPVLDNLSKQLERRER